MSSVSDIRQEEEANVLGNDNVKKTLKRRFTDHDAQNAFNIQRAYRNHRAAREREGKIVSAESRERLSHYAIMKKWGQVVDEAIEKFHESDSLSKTLTNRHAKLRSIMQGLVEVAGQIGKGTDQKDLWLILDNEHWLELYDKEHRYGANLKVYHDEWLKSKTPENFFDWLDKGEGALLNLSVSREQLNQQKVKYLDKSERKQLKVIIKDGLLFYEYTNKLVHTNPSTKYLENHAQKMSYDLTKLTGNLEKDGSPDEKNYVILTIKKNSDDGNKDKNLTNQKDIDESYLGVSAFGGEDDNTSMLSHDSGEDTNVKWIYVTDCYDNLYIHEKIKGHFHHSSFLAGGAICAAGGVKVYQGKLLEINPKSGHYKPGEKHFEALIEHLKSKELDTTYADIIYPNDLLEEKLRKKYHSRLVAHVSLNVGLFMKNVETVTSKQLDFLDRKVKRAASRARKVFHNHKEHKTVITTNHEAKSDQNESNNSLNIVAPIHSEQQSIDNNHDLIEKEKVVDMTIESSSSKTTTTAVAMKETTTTTTAITNNSQSVKIIKGEEKKTKRSSGGFSEFFAQVTTIFGKEKADSAKNNITNQNSNSQNNIQEINQQQDENENRHRKQHYRENSLFGSIKSKGDGESHKEKKSLFDFLHRHNNHQGKDQQNSENDGQRSNHDNNINSETVSNHSSHSNHSKGKEREK
ncbi:4356_t:CDS:2 [Ambispora gerdemannii]|uniref:4356_t:CDS:1 n=1 Tax=Ambispora gerdemannii TaxID=144530 RepID=A0A9N8YUM4_9GLOM|nr:4356_t:CDS:2 [Ambispora gerdemannii]